MNGRLDFISGGFLVLLASLSLIGPTLARADNVTIVETYDHANISSGDVGDACSAHQSAFDTGDPSINKNSCGGLDGADDAYVDTTDLSYKSEVWTTYGAPTGENDRFYWLVYESGCPDGTTEQPDGTCEEECTQGNTIQGDFAGEGLSVCTGGCSYTTTAGINSEDGTGSALVHETRYTDKPTYRAGYWENTGESCETGVAPEDGITASGGSTLAFEQDQPNCGTMNGERFCAESIPDTGKCTLMGGDGYVCGAQGEFPVVPDFDEATSTITEIDSLTIEGIMGEGSALTISSGTIDDTTPSDGLDEGTNTPTAGSGGAEDQAEEQEESKLCEEAPHLCDDSHAQELADKEMPNDEIDVSNLIGPGDYPNVITDAAVCPEPETFQLPEGMGGATLSMPYTAFCDFAIYINPLIHALSYLAAFFIGIRILI